LQLAAEPDSGEQRGARPLVEDLEIIEI